MSNGDILHLSFHSSVTNLKAESFSHEGFQLKTIFSVHSFRSKINHPSVRGVVISADHPTEEIVTLTHEIHEQKDELPIIITCQSAGVNDAVTMMKAGASDFFVASHPEEQILRSLKNALTLTSLNPEIPPDRKSNILLIGESKTANELRSWIETISKSDAVVLITGESGTGKEIVARLIHKHSNRNENNFVPINCAAIPKDVLENELFGHERGAFTGAIDKKDGCFEFADNGTLFLDEIGEMAPETQAKLLRVIEHQSYRRLGGSEEIKVNVRPIAATNIDIQKALEEGRLREDLYYRLSVIEVTLPPLRERTEDIPLLLNYYLDFFSKVYQKPLHSFSTSAEKILRDYRWPGNIRELRNVVERCILLSSSPLIDMSDLPKMITSGGMTTDGMLSLPIGTSSDEAQRQLISRTLQSVGYNKSKAAKMLGMSRRTLHNKLNDLSLEEL